jgi:sulfotransferase family protein
MNAVRRAGLGVLRAISPRHRRWGRLVRSLELDPERLERPVDEPGDRDFIICGLSRSGTSLLAAALYQPPRCVTLSEPWDGLRIPPAALFGSLREEIRTGLVRRGRLDVHVLERGEVRWGRDGEFPHRVDVDAEFALGVKWPVFWRYLDLLPRTKFLICVRHPSEVIASFVSTTGRLAEGLDYDVPFNRDMNRFLRAATDDPHVRPALLYEYVASRLALHLGDPNVFVVGYERWFSDREGLMRDVGRFLGIEVGLGYPAIRPPRSSGHRESELARLVELHCPSAVALGYGVGEQARRADSASSRGGVGP